MKKSAILFIISVCTILPTKLFAWGMTGHRVIAEIAERNISQDTKNKIQELLDGQCMAYWANWPDFIKSDTTDRWKSTHVWHFTDAPGGLSKDKYIATVKNIPQENLYGQLPKLKAILQDKTSSKEEKKEALAFIIHLVGDMHQPLHIGHEEDLGGNRVKVKWFGQETNLHTVWDSKLLNYEGYSYTEYATILNVSTVSKKQDYQAGTLEDWLFDVYNVADMVYKSVKPNEDLRYEYNYKMKYVVEDQLLKGGLRLAKYLDDIFAGN